MRALLEPGVFTSAPVRGALIIGAVTAVLSAVVGVFTVIRGQSFAGHALTDVATTGGSAAFYFGLTPLAGFVTSGVLGAGAMSAIGVERVRQRDLATGIVLGAATGLAALFLYLDTTASAATGSTQQILFGSIFSLSAATVSVVSAVSVATLIVVAFIHRPLLLSSLSPELASARGVSVRVVSLVFLLALALAVGLSSVAIGSILSTALLIGPAAAALRVTRRVASAIVAACALGVAATWLGILFAYDSFYWFPSHRALPASFFIVTIAFAFYLFTRLPFAVRRSERPGTREATRRTNDRGA